MPNVDELVTVVTDAPTVELLLSLTPASLSAASSFLSMFLCSHLILPPQSRLLLIVLNSPCQACEGAHAIAIMTDWDEFKTIDYSAVPVEHEGLSLVFKTNDCRSIVKRRVGL